MRALMNWAATSTVAHVGFAFLAMGGWAVFANRDHPLAEALQAGVVQGALSGLITLVLKNALERMNAFLDRRRTRRQAPTLAGEGASPSATQLILPPLITATTILLVLVTAHALAGTPEIATTIAVPFTVSTSYAIIYNWGLTRRRA
jgi:hypothetical protein